MLNVLSVVCSILFCSYPATQESRIVKIVNETGSGTGFLISNRNNKSFYVTNLHVCSSIYSPNYYQLSRVKVETGSGRLYNAETKVHDNRYDLCILSVDKVITTRPLAYKRIDLSRDDQLEILTQPRYGRNVAALYKGKDESKDAWSYNHHDNHVALGHCESGMSGSPVLRHGYVVGVVWGCTKDGRYAEFTPSRYLDDLLQTL